MKKPTNLLGAGIAIGVVFGVSISNIGLGIALGLAIGASMYYSQTKKNKTMVLNKHGGKTGENLKDKGK